MENSYLTFDSVEIWIKLFLKFSAWETLTFDTPKYRHFIFYSIVSLATLSKRWKKKLEPANSFQPKISSANIELLCFGCLLPVFFLFFLCRQQIHKAYTKNYFGLNLFCASLSNLWSIGSISHPIVRRMFIFWFKTPFKLCLRSIYLVRLCDWL